MLRDAGVAHAVVPADIDEDALKNPDSDPRALASALAQAKALAVSRDRIDAWVIGSDSVVSCQGRWFSKPRDRDEAAEHLRFFSGQKILLTSAVALAHGGAVDWSHSDCAPLQVRVLSERFIAAYLDSEWPAVSYCVGVFRMEGPGVQLFDSIEGSHFTILGMPLLPLLAALRERGIISA